MERRWVVLAAVVAALAVGAPVANAATWGVSDTTDTPVGQQCPSFTNCSLREAVTSTEANPGQDAILVSAGTYPLTNGQLTVTQDLSVSRVGAGAATISGSNSSRIFDISGSGTGFSLRFMTLTAGSVTTSGSPARGGAIRGGAGTTIDVQTTTISNSAVSSDADADGGAIYSAGGVTISTAAGSITGSVITGNSAVTTGSGGTAHGGGVAVSGSSLSVGARTTISANNATGLGGGDARGGGVWFDGSALQASFNAATVSGNSAAGDVGLGGGVDVQHGTGSFTRSTVSGNTATTAGDGVTGGGGGISSAGSIQLSFATLAGNTAEVTGTGSTAGGGAIGLFGSEPALNASNSTIASNSVSGSTSAGAGIYGDSTPPGTLAATILAENTGSAGSQCDGVKLSSGNYDVLGPLGTCTYVAGVGDVTGVTDAGLKPRANNGGLTETMMLELGSPALDVIPAANTLCTAAATDQRGVARPQGGNCDVGAVEARPGTLVITPDPRDFGYATLSTPKTANVSVSNTGELDVPAPGINLGAPFSNTNDCGSMVAAGSNCILGLQFAPTVGGRVVGTLKVRSGAARDSSTLTGIGWAPTVAPEVTGTPMVGQKMNVTTGRWPATVALFTAQWIRCDADGTSNCADIPNTLVHVAPSLLGSIRTVYTPVLADAGHTLRVRLIARSTTGVDSDPVTTAASAVVQRGTPTLLQAPVIERSSSPVVGTTLSANHGQWTGSPDSYTYQWIRCDADGVSNCTDLAGKTSNKYKPGVNDVGSRLRVRVTAHNPTGDSTPAVSSPSGVVSAQP